MSIDDPLAQAVARHRAGDLAGAAALYDRLLAERPDWPEVLHLYGLLAHQTGRSGAGAALIAAAVRRLPAFAEAWVNLGNARRAAGETAGARRAYGTALVLRPALAAALTGRGELDRVAGRPARAWRDQSRAVTLAPDLAEPWLGRGNAARDQGWAAQAEADFTRVLVLAPDHHGAALNRANSRLARGAVAGALGDYDRRARCGPFDPSVVVNRARALGALGRAAEGLPSLWRLAYDQPDDVRYVAALVDQYLAAGAPAAARRWGRRCLRLKDLLAPRTPASRPRVSVRAGRQVISFSLWGDDPSYTEGARANARLAPEIYPGWVCRFYHDDTVPSAVLADLAAAGAERVAMPRPVRPVEGLLWRFLVHDDPTVARFLVRDCDCRLNRREAAAVADWLASGLPFHVLRDHVGHVDLILAGLWGGVAGGLPAMGPAIRDHLAAAHNRWTDQVFLARRVWPWLRGRVRIHDSVYDLFGASDFPPGADLPAGAHVGGGVRIPLPSGGDQGHNAGGFSAQREHWP